MEDPVPDGSWKYCQCCVHNKDDQTTVLSNVVTDLHTRLLSCCNALFMHFSVCLAEVPIDLKKTF